MIVMVRTHGPTKRFLLLCKRTPLSADRFSLTGSARFLLMAAMTRASARAPVYVLRPSAYRGLDFRFIILSLLLLFSFPTLSHTTMLYSEPADGGTSMIFFFLTIFHFSPATVSYCLGVVRIIYDWKRSKPFFPLKKSQRKLNETTHAILYRPNALICNIRAIHCTVPLL